FRELALHRLLATFSGQSISNVAANHGAQRRHQRIVQPRLAMARSQIYGEDVHAAGQRNHGVVGDSQQDKTDSPQSAQLPPDRNHKQQMYMRQHAGWKGVYRSARKTCYAIAALVPAKTISGGAVGSAPISAAYL